jgi:hypothetical protein
MIRPIESEYAPHFRRYVDLVPEADVLPALDAQTGILRQVASGVTPDTELFAYGPDKWTIRQVFGHIGDVERVFGFRALAFSRLDPNPLPGFDDNGYVEQAGYADRPLADLIEDFAAVRTANLRMLKALREEQWAVSGIANGRSITVRAIAFVMVGHVRHHLNLLNDRYGVSLV